MNVIKSKYGNSSFWLDKFDTDVEEDFLTENEKQNLNLFALASRKRAIGNYVSILTGKQYPIKFKTRGDSYTDGEHIVISSKIEEPKDFDVAVGLALHEGSHLKLSDFTFLKELDVVINNKMTFDLENRLEKVGISKYQVFPLVKDILNFVEDRRIDNYVYRTSPGYRDYYTSLYDKYFNNSLVEKGLKSDEYTDETLDSYFFRLINLHSKSTRLDSLKGLREIYKLVDLRRIGRLKSSQDAFEVSWKIFEVILKNLEEIQPQGEENEEQPQQENDTQNNSGSESQEVQTSDEQNDEIGNGGSVNNVEGQKSSQSTSEPKEQLSERQKELLKKKIEKQKDFLRGEISKKTMTKKESEKIEIIDSSGSEIKTVGKGFENGWGVIHKGIDCILVKKVTQELMESDEFPFASKNYWDGGLRKPYQKEVDNGIKLGTLLSKKLQTRSESRDTIFNRQKTGKIDKRMISSLGFGNQNVFFSKDVDFYNDANLHITIDASGSMNGDKWERTLTNVVALCKAVDMISNLQVQVSLRSCFQSKPYIAMVYDSRVDSFLKVRKLFPSLHVSGTTPEGLTFEAILGEMVKGTNDVDSYFLNISDGEPYFQGRNFYYSGDSAAKHTNKMVKKIQEMGIKVISYFVSGDYDSSGYSKQLFGMAYGKTSNYIDVTSVNQVSKTMNKMFMTKV